MEQEIFYNNEILHLESQIPWRKFEISIKEKSNIIIMVNFLLKHKWKNKYHLSL